MYPLWRSPKYKLNAIQTLKIRYVFLVFFKSGRSVKKKSWYRKRKKSFTGPTLFSCWSIQPVFALLVQQTSIVQFSITNVQFTPWDLNSHTSNIRHINAESTHTRMLKFIFWIYCFLAWLIRYRSLLQFALSIRWLAFEFSFPLLI